MLVNRVIRKIFLIYELIYFRHVYVRYFPSFIPLLFEYKHYKSQNNELHSRPSGSPTRRFLDATKTFVICHMQIKL